MAEGKFSLLKNRAIIDILIGDTELESGYKMPYLSGPDICDIGQLFGTSVSYIWNGGSSRWAYMEKVMEYLLSQNRLNELLSYLFNLQQFRNSINANKLEEVEEIHSDIVDEAFKAINAKLVFSRHKLSFVNQTFVIHEIGELNVIEDSSLKNIDVPYVKELRKKVSEDLQNGNYDSVITKSRTMIEEVLIYILERNGYEDQKKGDINKLYGKVKQLVKMKQSKNYDNRVNDLLSGLQKIVLAVTEMRNARSDAHGVGRNRIAIRKHEAELVVNATTTFLVYLMEVYNS